MNNIGEIIHKQVVDTGILPILVKIVKKKVLAGFFTIIDRWPNLYFMNLIRTFLYAFSQTCQFGSGYFCF